MASRCLASTPTSIPAGSQPRHTCLGSRGNEAAARDGERHRPRRTVALPSRCTGKPKCSAPSPLRWVPSPEAWSWRISALPASRRSRWPRVCSDSRCCEAAAVPTLTSEVVALLIVAADSTALHRCRQQPAPTRQRRQLAWARDWHTESRPVSAAPRPTFRQDGPDCLSAASRPLNRAELRLASPGPGRSTTARCTALWCASIVRAERLQGSSGR